LMQLLSSWTLVAAGTPYMFKSISDVFSPIPRQFMKVDVGPYPSDEQVLECIRAPLLGVPDLDRRHVASISTAIDVGIVTGRRPYEINLVCYYIWEAIRSHRQDEFEPSIDVFDSVLQELRRNGRDIPEIELIKRLTPDDFETALDYLPFVDLSVEEI